MIFDRGDIVFMPFPFSDFSKFKNRPVLVITMPDVYGDFIAMKPLFYYQEHITLPQIKQALDRYYGEHKRPSPTSTAIGSR
jgi:hypothetical protein